MLPYQDWFSSTHLYHSLSHPRKHIYSRTCTCAHTQARTHTQASTHMRAYMFLYEHAHCAILTLIAFKLWQIVSPYTSYTHFFILLFFYTRQLSSLPRRFKNFPSRLPRLQTFQFADGPSFLASRTSLPEFRAEAGYESHSLGVQSPPCLRWELVY